MRGGGTCLNVPDRSLWAFTLAEVLITLAIIGVVAALTLPNLIANHQKKVLAGQAKHAYSLLSQAYTSAVAKHDDPVHWYTNVNVENERSIFEKYLFPELKGQASGSPVPKDKVLWQRCRDYLNSIRTSETDMNNLLTFERNGCFVLTSGALIFPATIETQEYGDYTRQYKLANVLIDVNGFKKPNKKGKDIFSFFIIMKPIIGGIYLGTQGGNIGNFHYQGIFPAGYDGEGNAYTCTKYSTGLSPECTAKLMKDGWEFKDDYPW